MSEKIFCIKTVQNKGVSGEKPRAKAAGWYFLHSSAVSIPGSAAFLEECKKALAQMLFQPSWHDVVTQILAEEMSPCQWVGAL